MQNRACSCKTESLNLYILLIFHAFTVHSMEAEIVTLISTSGREWMAGFILDYSVMLWVSVLVGEKVTCLFLYSNVTIIQHFIPHTSNT